MDTARDRGRPKCDFLHNDHNESVGGNTKQFGSRYWIGGHYI